MSYGWTDRLLRSTSFRVSLLHGVLLLAAFAGAIGGTFLASRGAAERELRERILLEAHAIGRAIERGGLEEGVADVAARAERPGAVEYRLVDPQGHLVGGDLPVFDAPAGWSVARLPPDAPGAEGRERLLVLTEPMPDGSRLTVGDDLDRIERVRGAVLAVLAWAGGLAAAAGLLAGLVLTRRTLRRMETVAATVSAFAEGDLAARAPARASGGDDLDAHARGVNAMLDRIAELLASVRRVSTAVAHDLRTPLAHARQKLEAARAAPTSDARDAAIAAAGDRIDEALRIFEATLRLAEIEAGAARARFARVDLAEVVERIADAYRPEVEGGGRRLAVGPLQSVLVEGDEELIGQALANLIENAMRHTPTGATITLGVEADGDCAGLRVADDGPGVPEGLRAAVLEPFQRADAARTTTGAGLGLAIVAAIARLHGAGLRLDDARPGLQITLQFPRGLAAGTSVDRLVQGGPVALPAGRASNAE